jgi:nuclear pore complex protein Nup188
VVSLVELVPVEMIPDFDSFVEVWIALFGRSESSSVSSICAQFWKVDLRVGNARKAILDVARSRFPIQIRPLVRILRALTGTGFLDTDPLSAADQILDRDTDFEERDLCSRYVFYYMNKLPTFSQVVHSTSCTGSHALYEKHAERYGTSVSGIGFVNTRPLRLPGGSILPSKSVGRLLSSDGGDLLVVSWTHDHSGWGLVLEVLRHYVQRKGLSLTSESVYPSVALVGKGTDRPVALSLADIGTELNESEDEQLVTDILDLIRCVIKENEIIAESMLEVMEQSAAMTESPDLIQMTTIILEDALVRASKRPRSTESFSPLITSAISVLGALLALPKYSSRVWLYVRSTTALFGPEGSIANASVTLASERVRGEYGMTLAILQFAHQLLDEAIASLATVVSLNPRLQQVKEEILLRISRFIHTELWIEHNAWKYAQLGDRFEIGRRISAFYYRILVLCPTPHDSAPFAALCEAVRQTFLYKASNLTISPLLSTITSMSSTLEALYTSRRYGDARKLISVTESHLRFSRALLNGKRMWTPNAPECLLEQAFCARTFGTNTTTIASKRPSTDPIDDVAGLIKKRDLGTTIPAEAVRLLHALSALISTQPSPPSIIGHLVDAEATVASLVRIAQHPYDDLSLRCAIWDFMALAVDTEPALAGILVTGTYRSPLSVKDKEKTHEKTKDSEAKRSAVESAFDVARKTLGNWRALWESNPQLLAGALHFLEVIFQHGLEHTSVLESIRKDDLFWTDIAAVHTKELGPAPAYKANGRVIVDGVLQSNLHEDVTVYSYRTFVKSHALQIIGLDVENFVRSVSTDKVGLPKPLSFEKIRATFTDLTRFRALTSEASANSYDPELYDELTNRLKINVGAISLDQLQHLRPPSEREYGDEYAFSVDKLRVFLKRHQNAEDAMREDQASMEDLLTSVNLNLSLAHGQSTLRRSWQNLLKQAVAYLRDDVKTRSTALSIASSLAAEFAQETRSGDMMASIWSEQLSLLLALVEVSWFSTNTTTEDVKSLVSLSSSIRSIVLSPDLPPLSSLMGNYASPFHNVLLQVMFFCIRECRSLFTRTKSIRAEDRLVISALFEASQNLTIKALRFAFDSARARYDVSLDTDMGLLVAVLDQATRLDVVPSPLHWLNRCQEEDLIRASLELFARTDLAGLFDLSILVTQKRPLYAQHILTFHTSLASIPTAAERLANEGLLAAYSNNALSAAINAGSLETTLPELPAHRSPAHANYCMMLSIVTTVSLALGRQTHFFDVELCSFVQSCGDQIHRALSWTIDQPMTFSLLDEMDRTVNLFYAIAENCPTPSKDASVERVLRVFSAHAVLLLQQLNYALTHPNQLAKSFDPITVQDRLLVEQEQKDASMSASVSYDPTRRPLLTSLIYRFYKLCSVILHTLNLVSCGFTVLTQQVESWPAHEALIIPVRFFHIHLENVNTYSIPQHSKVVLGERASLGTLLELGNATLDILRVLINQPAGRAIPSASGPLALDVRASAEILRGNLEAILFYSATQLVMWITKPEDDSAYKDVDNDDYLELGESGYRMGEDPGARSRQPRTALADRVRRGMRGEIVEDLQGLLTRAKPIIAKSDSLLGNKTPDISQILSDFLRERASLML